MSISSMTNVAFERREDVEPLGRAPKSLDEIAEAKGENPSTKSPVTSALDSIMTYIPTEILTLYVAVVAALNDESRDAPGIPTATQGTFGEWAIFVVFLVLTPAAVWLIYAAKCANANKRLPTSPPAWPKWEMFAGTLAYVVWAFAIPDNPFEGFDWYSAALAGIIVLIVSAVLGLISPIVHRTLAP